MADSEMDEKSEIMPCHGQNGPTVFDKGNLDVAQQKVSPENQHIDIDCEKVYPENQQVGIDCGNENASLHYYGVKHHEINDRDAPHQHLALAKGLERYVKILDQTQKPEDVLREHPTENVGKFFFKEEGNLDVHVAESEKVHQDVYIEAEAEYEKEQSDFGRGIEQLYKNLTCLEHTYTDMFIDNGSFGSCFRRKYTDGQIVVYKKIKMELGIPIFPALKLELEFSGLQPHANIVRVLAYVILPGDRECYLFMEDGGYSLFTKSEGRQRFNADELAKHHTSIMRGCLEAVAHIHNKGYLYLDAKPQNTVTHLDERRCTVKLCDMGSLFKVGQGQKLVATVKYMAPETMAYWAGQHVDLTAKSDVLNMGLLYYYILTGEHPWPNYSEKESLMHDLCYRLDFFGRMCPKAVGCNTAPYILQRRMVARHPDDRPSIKECLEELRKMKEPCDPYEDGIYLLGTLPEPIEKMNGKDELPIVLDELSLSLEIEEDELPIVLDELTLSLEIEESDELPCIVELNLAEEYCAAMVPKPTTSGIVSDLSGAPTEESITVHPNLD